VTFSVSFAYPLRGPFVQAARRRSSFFVVHDAKVVEHDVSDAR
jgi:hypothetical protein